MAQNFPKVFFLGVAVAVLVPPRDCHIEFTGDTLKMPISDDLMGSKPRRLVEMEATTWDDSHLKW